VPASARMGWQLAPTSPEPRLTWYSGIDSVTWMSPTLRLLALSTVLMVSCNKDDAREKVARAFLAKGPRACCGNQAPTPELEVCYRNADTECAFLRDATLRRTNVGKLGDATTTVFTFEADGPNGQGKCEVMVSGLIAAKCTRTSSPTR
jgi:hypothetical protein